MKEYTFHVDPIIAVLATEALIIGGRGRPAS